MKRSIRPVTFLTLLLLLCTVLTLAACGGTHTGDPADSGTQPAGKTDPVPGESKAPVTDPDTEPETDADPAPDFSGLVDFVVEVEPGREIRVLQLTDTQIIDAGQSRYDTRLIEIEQEMWATDMMESCYKGYLREIITETRPDFIFITGDVVYGEFDDSGSTLTDFIAFMEGFGIPWAPVFGNHDNESKMGADWQCRQFEEAGHCLFLQRTLTGNGNYSVGLSQGGKLVRVFFMLDSNGCGNMSAESKANKHSTTTIGFGNDQVKWVIAEAEAIRAADPQTNISFAFHIQPAEFTAAFSKYGFKNADTIANPIDIDNAADKAATDFGYLGRDLKSPWSSAGIWKKLLETGTDSVFVGHEHCNCGSVVCDGVRYQYGMKSSTYDRINFRLADGSIVGGSEVYGTPLVGGTLMTLEEGTGEIKDAHIVYATTKEVKPAEKPDAAYTYVLDFNGTDFDVTVTTDGLNREPVGKVVPEGSDGATGAVTAETSDYLVSVGVKLPADVPYESVSSFRVRMRVTEKTKHSRDPLFRLYDDRNNTIRTGNGYTSVGGVFGEWCEIEIVDLLKSGSLVKNGTVQPFSIVYRCYDADAVIEFDSLIIETVDEVPGLGQAAESKDAA